VAEGSRSNARRISWVVAEPGERLGAVLESLGVSPRQALEEGRVFVRGQRACSAAEQLAPGDRVEVFRARAVDESARILATHAGLVAAHKPARMPTEPDRTGCSTSLVQAVARELGVPGETLHALGRLDVGVSGLVVVATSRAARLAALRARAEGRLERRYVALAPRAPEPPRGRWDAPLEPPRRGWRRGHPDPRRASTAYGHVAAVGLGRASVGWPDAPAAMVVFEPLTGRSHQIRAHAAQAGLPLLGDHLYGGPANLVEATGATVEFDRIALHSLRLRLLEGRGCTWEVVSAAPPDLRGWWQKLGGDEGAWSASLGIEL
jgi:23S rRNA pseudouridine1911/1915/1917 synthase